MVYNHNRWWLVWENGCPFSSVESWLSAWRLIYGKLYNYSNNYNSSSMLENTQQETSNSYVVNNE